MKRVKKKDVGFVWLLLSIAHAVSVTFAPQLALAIGISYVCVTIAFSFLYLAAE